VPVEPIGESAEESQIESGRKGREAFATIKQRFSVDENAIKGMSTQFDAFGKSLDFVNKKLDDLITKGRSAMDALGGLSGAAGSGGGGAPIVSSQTHTRAGTGGSTGASLTSPSWDNMQKSFAGFKAETQSFKDTWKKRRDRLADQRADPDHAGFGGKYGNWMFTRTSVRDPLSSPAAQVAMAGINWTRNRVQGSSDYMLTSDRTGMLMRQMYGGTQLQYQRRYREPMTNALIGNEGIEQMLNLQLTTGLGASREQQQRMLSGVEGIRVASGFGYSTGQATQMISALAQPGSSNMMTMMLGMGLYGPGGRQRDPMDVIRNTVRRMGLTNEQMVQGAFQPGSMTRANLSRTGLPVDMQNMVLQYAQENIEFQKQGGEGMYDPSNSEHRQRMGVEQGYATEFERTRREETRRQEDFYRRQIDNYENVEENTQALIKMTAAIEDKFSGLIGAQMNVMQHPATRIAAPILGAIAGAVLSGGNPIAVRGGAVAGMALASAIGDEDDPHSAPVTPTNFGNKGLKSSLVGDGQRTGVQAMANAAADAGHKLVLISGTRTNSAQLKLFTDRHDLVIPGNDPSGINGRRRSDGLRYYDGTGGGEEGWYALNRTGEREGLAMPPGASKHQTGDAADLGPEKSHPWIAANASRFGLKNPTNAQGAPEPWHVSLARGENTTLAAGGAGGGSSAGLPPVAAELEMLSQMGTSSSTAESRGRALNRPSSAAARASAGTTPIILPQSASKSTAPIAPPVTKPTSVSTGVATVSGNTITIAPSITLAGTGSDAVDAKNLANAVIKIIETSDAVQALRTT